MRIIEQKYFDELIRRGDTVPRNIKTGETLTNFTVSKNYEIKAKESGQKALVRCTQDCPTNLRLIKKI